MKNIVVLLTGTINPGGMTMTAIQDIDLRKQQYIESIKYWCKVEGIKVVFVENSNYNFIDELTHFEQLGNFEFLSFDGNTYNKSLGKGVGELQCITYALENSEFVRLSDFIFKVTGRYIVLNFKTFSNYVINNPETDLLVDLKLFLTFSDSRIFGFKKSFISEYMVPYNQMMNDSKGFYFENALAKATLSAIVNNYVYRALPELPRIKGYSASLGRKFKSSYLHWIKHKFKYYLKYKSFGLGHMPDF